MRWPSVALVSSALAGCSLLYNPSNLPGAVDARPPDADPCALALGDVGPTTIDEGQGTGGSAPAVVVLRGDNLVNANLRVTLAAVTGTVHLAPVTDAVASSDHRFVAFTVTAPIDGDLGMTGEVLVPLGVTVSQDAGMSAGCVAAASRTDLLKLRGLPELRSSQAITIATSTLKSKYSEVALSDVTFTGTARAELDAAASIDLGVVKANATFATAGPGGLPGGATPGMGPGRGDAGGPATALGNGGGGGGAGYADRGMAGDAGAGTAGTGGQPYGQDQILSYQDSSSSSGGVGGKALAAVGGTPGGPGGGGGGMIVLAAGGNIKTGNLEARGGAGSAPSSGSGGGGGGGAGGTVVVRSENGTLMLGMILVPGGDPGSPGGGRGSVGRVRWDAPSGTPPSSPSRTAHRGPAFVNPPRIVTARGQAFTLTGSAGDELDVRAIDQDNVPHSGEHASFNSDGIAVITPRLTEGYNRLCVKVAPGLESEAAANTCIDVAFVP